MYQIFQRNKKIRVSFSCLLKIQNEDKYLLIKNQLRPQQYGPIGGALKYCSTAKSFFNSIGFEADTLSVSKKRHKLIRDLRGFIPAKNLFKLIDWFEKKTDREETCLHRELKEELTEISASDLLKDINTPEFSLVRQIIEPPHKVPGKSFLQFRIFRVDEFSSDYLLDSHFIDILDETSKTNNNLIWVTSDEIKQGIDNRENIIGSHSNYLISDEKELQEDRPWTTKK